MWLEQEKFREINHVVVKGERRGLSRLFAELFHPDNQKYSKNPTLCPHCQKPLVRKMNPYLEYFVQACPDRHGAWMSPEVSAKLKQLVSEQMQVAARKKQAVQLLIAAVAGMILFAILSNSPQWFRLSALQDLKIGENSWPERDFRNFPGLPTKESAINNAEELLYFSDALLLLEKGATNRMNMEVVLGTRRSEEKYWKAFSVYQQKQYEFLAKWRMLAVPEPLKAFHAKVETAAQAQMEFYAAFIQEKVRDRAVTLQDMLQHPALRTCNSELLGAFDLVQQRYPDLDPQSQQAIESRLCWFDVI